MRWLEAVFEWTTTLLCFLMGAVAAFLIASLVWEFVKLALVTVWGVGQ